MGNVQTKSGDSGLERQRESELKLLLRGKYIRELKVRQPLDITPLLPGYAHMSWKIDFQYEEKVGPRKWTQVYEDSKAPHTFDGLAQLKAKLVMGRYCPPAIFRISHRTRDQGIKVDTLTKDLRVDFEKRRQ